MVAKVIVITGASAGIGAALAKQLAGRGDKLVLAARREKELKEVAGACGADALPVVADVTQRAAVEHIRDEALRVFGHVDVWINNAGRGIGRPVLDLTDADFDEIMAINVTGVFLCSQAVAKRMIPRGHGKIISIGSMQSEIARPTIAPYTASKGAVKNLIKGMATDWARHGLQCNGIGPGYFITEMTKALVENPEFDAWLKNRTPAHRWGDVKELIGAAVFLASDASSFVNGHMLYVDGGMLACV